MTAPEYSTAMPDWEERILSGRSLVPPPIFPDQAELALSVFKQLRVVDAAGSPRFGECSAPWVFDFVSCVFGAYDAAQGERLIKEFFLLISKKQGKSTVAAGIMLTALILNWRKSAQLVIISPTIQVADASFVPCADMVNADPRLKELIHVNRHERTLRHNTTRATLKVLAADGDTVTGSKASWLLIDELHLMGEKSKAPEMLREAQGGLASRPEGCVIKLSTMSSQPPAGVFKEDLNLFRDIRDGVITDKRRVGVLYEHPRSMVLSGEARSLEATKLTNPGLGWSVEWNYIEDQYQRAKGLGEKQFADFLAKHSNVEIGLNQASDRWAGASFWEAQEDETLTLDTLMDRCDVVTVGIDGGGLDDLLGLTVMGRDRTTRNWLSWSKAWAHEISLERRKDTASRMRDFEKDGDLSIVALPGDDVREVCELISVLELSGLLPEKQAIGVDPVGISAIIDMLTSDEYNIDISRIVAVGQGYRLNGAIKTVERALAGKTLVHAKQPLMNWAVGNCKITIQGSAIMITKAASGTAKIDPVIALFNAASLLALNPAGRGNISDYLKSFKT